MENENKIMTPEEELTVLKKRILLLEAQPEKETMDQGREELTKRAIREYAEQDPKKILDEKYQLSTEKIRMEAERVAKLHEIEQGHVEKMRELFQIVEDKGILNAITVVKSLNDPHLEDDFHDLLVEYLRTNGS